MSTVPVIVLNLNIILLILFPTNSRFVSIYILQVVFMALVISFSEARLCFVHLSLCIKYWILFSLWSLTSGQVPLSNWQTKDSLYMKMKSKIFPCQVGSLTICSCPPKNLSHSSTYLVVFRCIFGQNSDQYCLSSFADMFGLDMLNLNK